MPDITLTNYTIDDSATVLAAAPLTFGANSDLALRLVNVPFAPDPTLGIDDLTYASLNGLNPKVGVASAPTLTWDSAMGVWGFNIPFTGGNVFTCTAVEIPPVTAYGWAIVNTAEDKLILTGIFDEPVVFDHIGVSAHVPETNAWFAAPFMGDLPTPSV